jgi:hypothetical protein
MAKKKRIKRDDADLLKQLSEQVKFLVVSCALYDKGMHEEAKRLATTIRVLVHDTQRSQSLLLQLNAKTIKFYDTAAPYLPENMLTQSLLLKLRVSPEGGAYEPSLYDGSTRPRKVTFHKWWNSIVLVDESRSTFTRKELVLTVSNQDGGAHVDPALDEKYAKLTRTYSMGWYFIPGSLAESKTFNKSPVLASLRQIGHEMLLALRDKFPELAKEQ